jgi:LPS sulfotransferase NodH
MILERGSTSNGVFSFKVFSHQFDLTKSTCWPERLPGLHFVHLQRRDILGQAISRVRAEQTGKFRSYAAGHGGAEYYDSGAITKMLEQLVIGNARWAAYFAMTGKQPLPLYYEDVIADPLSAVSLTANLMAVTAKLNLDAVDLRVQRDAVSEEWRQKYLGEENARDGLPRLLNGRPEALAQSFVRRIARRVQAPSSR